MEVVHLAVLDLVVAPRRPAQPAQLRPMPGLGRVHRVREGRRLLGRERPLAHLGIGAGRHVDAADRWVLGQPAAGRHGRQPVRVRLERREELLDPVAVAPAVGPRRRPRPELLAIVAHHPDARPVLGGVLAQVLDDILDRSPRDPVTQPLLGPEDGDRTALVLGDVRAPQPVLRDRGGAEVRVIEDRPGVPARRQGCGQVGLPDPLGQPRARRPRPEHRLELVAHPAELPHAIALRQRHEDRLRVAAPHDLDLAATGEHAKPVDEGRALLAHPVEQRAAVVQGDPHRRVALERLDHRQVRLLVDLRDDPAEVADRLVVVEGERERDPGGHGRAGFGLSRLRSARAGRPTRGR